MPFLVGPFHVVPINRPPIAIIDLSDSFVVRGELVVLSGKDSYDPEGQPLTFFWVITQKPFDSQVAVVTPLTSDASTVSFVPDKSGRYEITLMVNDGVLDSAAVRVVLIAREVNVPTGQSNFPDVSFLYQVIRDWIYVAEDRGKFAAFWSAAQQIVAQLCLQLYEINLSKSIRTIPRLVQRKWYALEMRVDVPADAILNAGERKTGGFGAARSSITANTRAVYLDLPVRMPARRALVFGGGSYSAVAEGSPITFTRLGGASFVGTGVLLNEEVSGVSRNVRWFLPSGTIRSLSSRDLWLRRCSPGDLLTLRFVNAAADEYLFYCRVVSVAKDGVLGFEWNTRPLSLSHIYDITMPEVRDPFAEMAYRLGIDDQNVERIASLVFSGQLSRLKSEWGIEIFPVSVLRTSTFDVPIDTVAVPTLQSTVVDPVFILLQNTDYVIEEDADGKYVRLGVGVVLDESDLPYALWAEMILLDNARSIEDRFGILVGGTREELPERVRDYRFYRDAVLGLMYAFATGPTPNNIRLGVQIALGLPFTSNRSEIVDILLSFQPNESLIILEEVNDAGDRTGVQRALSFPSRLSLETMPGTSRSIQRGDVLPPFFPLTVGVEIRDWVNTPSWWFPLFDGRVGFPLIPEATFDHQWVLGQPYPPQAVEEFQETQKIHLFQVSIDSDALNPEDLGFAIRFVRGMRDIYFRHGRQMGVKPSYTDALFAISLRLEDQLEIEDAISLAPTFWFVDDIAGYEPALRANHDNGSSNPLIYQDTPLLSSRLTQIQPMSSLPPTLNGKQGQALLDIVTVAGSWSIGDILLGGLAQAVIVEIASPSLFLGMGPRTDTTLLVNFLTTETFFQFQTISTGGGAVAVVHHVGFDVLESSEPLRVQGYSLPRYRDVAKITGRYGGGLLGRWRVYSLEPDDLRLHISKYHPQDSDAPPYASTMYRPVVRGTVYVEIERMHHNPISDASIYRTPHTNSYALQATLPDVTVLSLSEHLHSDNIRGEQIARVFNAGLSHLSLSSIGHQRTGEEIGDLGEWDILSGTPTLSLQAPSTPIDADGFIEIYDPRLPYVKYHEGTLASPGELLPTQVIPGLYAPSSLYLLLPPTAVTTVDFYVGMALKVLGGSGFDLVDFRNNVYYITSFNPTDRIVGLDRPRNVLYDNTTRFEIVSLKIIDNAPILSQLAFLFPGQVLELGEYIPLKWGDGMVTAGMNLSAGNNTVIATGTIQPAGKDFATPNVFGDTAPAGGPVTYDVPLPGDILVLSAPAGASNDEQAAASRVYEIVAVPSPTDLEVSPTPTETVTSMAFTVFRQSTYNELQRSTEVAEWR